jgi:hypothetical protein
MSSGTQDGETQPLLQGQNGGNATNGAPDPSNFVGWDGPEDIENPRNWTTRSKTSIIGILTAITILSYIFFKPLIKVLSPE